MTGKKTMMISLIQVGVPLGVVAGYFLTSLIKDSMGWSFSFIIQAIFVGFSALIILFVPSIYFSSSLSLRRNSLDIINGGGLASTEDDMSIYRNTYIHSRFASIEGEDQLQTPKKQKTMIGNKLFKNLCIILKHKTYLFSALSLASLFFVITAVQYWGSDYMENALGVENKSFRLLSFSIVCITSPTFGVILGGWSITYIGGYESKHSILLCFIYALLASLFSIPVPIMDDLTYFTIFLWFVLFFGGAIVSPLTGIIISTLPSHLRGSANSVTSFLANLLGYLPAPFVYGIINENYKTTNPKIAFYFIMYYSVTGVIFLFFAMVFRYKHFTNLNNHIARNLLVEIKRTNRVSSGSIISTNLAKVFGNYQSYETEKDLINEEQDDVNLDLDKSDIIKNKEHININKGNSKEEDSEDSPRFNDYENENELNFKKTYTPALVNPSLQTPQFNALQNSHDFDYLKKEIQNDKFTKEESIFAPELNYSEPTSFDIGLKKIENINIEITSKSFSQMPSESLEKDKESLPNRKSSEEKQNTIK